MNRIFDDEVKKAENGKILANSISGRGLPAFVRMEFDEGMAMPGVYVNNPTIEENLTATYWG